MKKEMLALFFLVDALGWIYVKDRPFLDDLVAVRKPIKTILGYSSAAIPSILTGQLPRNHGQWNLLFLNPEGSPFRWIKPLLVLPDPCLENRWARKAINVITRRLTNHEGYFSSYGVPTKMLPMFDLAEKKNLYKPGGVPGSKTIFDLWQAENVDYITYSYHESSDEEIISRMISNIEKGVGTFHFAYLAEVDAFLHQHCKDEPAVKNVIAKYEKWIRKVIATGTKHFEKISFFVFSDHGMTPINRTLDLRGTVEKSGLKLGQDYLAVYDSTMARFWFRTERAEPILTEVLSTVRGGRLLSDTEKKELGIDFPHNGYGDIIFLLEPGLVISPNFIGSYVPNGMHGFHPDDPYSDGCFMTNTPHFGPRCITELRNILSSETYSSQKKDRTTKWGSSRG